MIEIVIGRDGTTSQLKLSVGQQSKSFGAQGSVPQTVSRQHCSLTVNDNGTYTLKNLKLQNVTFVNGQQIGTKTISDSDTIELGPDKYLVSWSVLKTVLPVKVETVDIRPLKRIWEEFDKRTLELDIAERKFNVIRSATGILSMSAIACAFVFGQGSKQQILLYGLAIGVSVIFFIISSIKAKKVPLKRRELMRDLENHYVCPNPKCHKILTKLGSYKLLSQSNACPYCKAKFKT